MARSYLFPFFKKNPQVGRKGTTNTKLQSFENDCSLVFVNNQ
jgi:hypothetical protein